MKSSCVLCCVKVRNVRFVVCVNRWDWRWWVLSVFVWVVLCWVICWLVSGVFWGCLRSFEVVLVIKKKLVSV